MRPISQRSLVSHSARRNHNRAYLPKRRVLSLKRYDFGQARDGSNAWLNRQVQSSACATSKSSALVGNSGVESQRSRARRRVAPQRMKIFPLNKGGSAKRLGVVAQVFLNFQDNPLKAPRLPSVRLLSPFEQGEFRRSRACRAAAPR